METKQVELGQVAMDSVSIAASPDHVDAYLADPANLPEWAPEFAESIRADGDAWVVTSKGTTLRVLVVASARSRTVDVVPAVDPRIGLFVRALPNGDGCECVFAVSFPAGTPSSAVEAQMAIVTVELRFVRDRIQGGAGP